MNVASEMLGQRPQASTGIQFQGFVLSFSIFESET